MERATTDMEGHDGHEEEAEIAQTQEAASTAQVLRGRPSASEAWRPRR